MVYCNAHYRICTPTVRGATGPPNLCQRMWHSYGDVSQTTVYIRTAVSPNLCTQAVRAPVRQRKLASCTDPYSSCTKMLFASEFSTWGVQYHAHFENCTTTV